MVHFELYFDTILKINSLRNFKKLNFGDFMLLVIVKYSEAYCSE